MHSGAVDRRRLPEHLHAVDDGGAIGGRLDTVARGTAVGQARLRGGSPGVDIGAGGDPNMGRS